MANLKKKTVYTTSAPVPETPIDKTARVVRIMNDDAAEQRLVKMARLRKDRLERDDRS